MTLWSVSSVALGNILTHFRDEMTCKNTMVINGNFETKAILKVLILMCINWNIRLQKIYHQSQMRKYKERKTNRARSALTLNALRIDLYIQTTSASSSPNKVLKRIFGCRNLKQEVKSENY
jgi:hypothetical protein